MSEGEFPFHPIVQLPEEYWVFDFTKPNNTDWKCPFEYQIGRYDEHRPGMYNTELFGGERDLHVGLDIGAPVSTPVYAFADGKVFSKGINPEAGSYGPTIITEHELQLPNSVGSRDFSPAQKFWVLHGHLSTESLDMVEVGESFTVGQVIATIGHEYENGGWPPHIHIQLSLRQPEVNDLPGVVKLADREVALKLYPDPRLIVGPVY
ncbi:MAG TPA: peptidoglycan DD-metalloendopeptidase family protein [Candidatus Poseidoniaceae archaeon]|nr:MAG TPA: peptidase M23 [Candidatus Poseidoniales archaeon]HII45564.1 peptidoglycan DD-metalloendopeptidase family protein [Candidatus Poseidoniaceae archaeon]|tara:strand:- start:1760 stop:2380 length:621 start_codon:yes stop_codon:yes gene_type:complete